MKGDNLFLLAGAFSLISFLGIFVIINHLMRVKTGGTMISVSNGKATVKYKVGKLYKTFTFATTKYRVGDKVTVFYLKGRPQNVQINTHNLVYFAIPVTIASSIVGGLLFRAFTNRNEPETFLTSMFWLPDVFRHFLVYPNISRSSPPF